MNSIRVWLADKTLRFFGALIMEPKGDQWMVSQTRVALWLVLLHCLWVWVKKGAADPDELYTLWALLGLTGIKHLRGAATDVVSILKGGTNGSGPTTPVPNGSGPIS